MALSLDGGDADHIDHGVMGNWNPDALSAIMWVYLDDVANNLRDFFGKADDAVWLGLSVYRLAADGTAFRIERTTSGDSARATSNSAVLTTGWNCIAAAMQGSGDVADNKVYWGNLSTSLADVTNAAVGTGVLDSIAAYGMTVGNYDSGDRNWSIPGDIAYFACWGAELSLAQLRNVQFSQNAKASGVAPELEGHYGFHGNTTVVDMSGNGYHGTAVGTALAAHAPLGPPFGWDTYLKEKTIGFINIGDVWKRIGSVQINIGDVWKDLSQLQMNVGDAWKDV